MQWCFLDYDGPPVIGTNDRDWVVECDRLLGLDPTPTALRGGVLKLVLLYDQFFVDLLKDVQGQ